MSVYWCFDGDDLCVAEKVNGYYYIFWNYSDKTKLIGHKIQISCSKKHRLCDITRGLNRGEIAKLASKPLREKFPEYFI